MLQCTAGSFRRQQQLQQGQYQVKAKAQHCREVARNDDLHVTVMPGQPTMPIQSDVESCLVLEYTICVCCLRVLSAQQAIAQPANCLQENTHRRNMDGCLLNVCRLRQIVDGVVVDGSAAEEMRESWHALSNISDQR